MSLRSHSSGISALERLLEQVEALEDVAEHAVELVEVALVLHQRGAREIVEILDAAAGEIGLHRLHQRQVFAQRDGHAGGFQFGEELDEHGLRIRPRGVPVKAIAVPYAAIALPSVSRERCEPRVR